MVGTWKNGTRAAVERGVAEHEQRQHRKQSTMSAAAFLNTVDGPRGAFLGEVCATAGAEQTADRTPGCGSDPLA